MKKCVVVAAAIAAFGFVNFASAADMPVKARPMPAVSGWTGFYIGGVAGGAWGHEVGTTLFTTALSAAGSETPGDISGFVGGLDVGFNYQVSPSWVIGVESDWLWTNTKGSTSRTSNVAGILLNGSTNVHWYSTVTGRIGYVMSDWLIYGKGGAAFTRADYNGNATAGTVVLENATISVSRSGWTAGIGAERMLQMIAPRLTAKIEYDYLDFGTDRILFTFPGIGTNGADTKTHVHLVKVGINYLFYP